MQIRMLFFGVLKDLAGTAEETIELPEGAQVADLLAISIRRTPRIESMLSASAISVNQKYASANCLLAEGDEVGFLPPVSGGSRGSASARGEVRIVREAIATQAVLDRLKRSGDGAAVIFEGVVRDNTRGRRTLYLDYEAYEVMALREMEALAEEARTRFAVGGIAMIHRLGRLEIGETSVLIVVTSAHRGAAFEACRWIIDTLKKTVPIWKKEYFEDGAVWADGEPFPEEIQRPGAQRAETSHPSE